MRGVVSGWNYDLGAEFGHSGFDYNMTTTLNASLGPCLDVPCAPGADGVLGHRRRSRAFPTRPSSSPAACCASEFVTAVNVARPVKSGCRPRSTSPSAPPTGGRRYKIRAGEPASYVNGFHLDQDSTGPAPAGSSGFPGFTPENASERDRTNFGLYADAETDLTPKLLANVAARFESYNDFGEKVSGKVALRFQPSRGWCSAPPPAPASAPRA